MTPETEAAIRERASKATPGPWTNEEWAEIAHSPDSVVHAYYEGRCPACSEEISDESRVAVEMDDLDFLTHAREDVPALLAALDASRERLAEAEARIEAVRALHFSQPWSACDCCDEPDECRECRATTWPCPTIEALDGEQR